SRTSIAAVVACMKDLGYPLSIGAWSELENGINQPRNGLAFLDAVERCLRLTQEQRDDLLERLAFDTLFARFGPRITQLPYLRGRTPAWEYPSIPDLGSSPLDRGDCPCCCHL